MYGHVYCSIHTFIPAFTSPAPSSERFAIRYRHQTDSCRKLKQKLHVLRSYNTLQDLLSAGASPFALPSKVRASTVLGFSKYGDGRHFIRYIHSKCREN